MQINLFADEAETALESYFRTLRGIASSTITVKIESEPPPPVTNKPELSNTAILDEIAAAPKVDKIHYIKKIREFASDNGVYIGLGFAKKLVELAPQFRGETSAYPPVTPQ